MNPKLLTRCLVHLLKREHPSLFKRLAHLIAAAHQYGVDIGTLFFVCPADQSQLHALFCNKVDEAANDDGGGIVATYTDGISFRIQACSLPYLVMTANLVAELLGFEEFMLRARDIARVVSIRGLVEAIALDWADAFEQYRQKRGGISQQNHRFKTIIEFLDRRFGEGCFSYMDIQPDQVLDFWIEHCRNKDLNVQRYSKVHQLFVSFIEHFATAADKVDSGLPNDSVGLSDYLDSLVEVCSSLHGCTWQDDWLALVTEFPQITFLNKADLSNISYLTDLPAPAMHLALSALRSHCFAPLQNALIEFSSKSTDKQLTRLLHLQETQRHILNYTDAIAKIEDAISEFRKICLACAHILITHQHPEGLQLLFAICPDLIGHESFPHDAPTSRQSHNGSVQTIQQQLAANAPLPERLQQAMQKSREAWEFLDSNHYLKNDLIHPCSVTTVAAVAERLPNALLHLHSINRRLKNFLKTPEQKMLSDISTILVTFALIYQNW